MPEMGYVWNLDVCPLIFLSSSAAIMYQAYAKIKLIKSG